MKTRIVKIGNSRGVRIPKPLLDQAGLDGPVEIVVRDRTLVIRAAKARAGWDDSFRSMALHGDDALLEPIPTSDWDDAEWEW